MSVKILQKKLRVATFLTLPVRLTTGLVHAVKLQNKTFYNIARTRFRCSIKKLDGENKLK